MLQSRVRPRSQDRVGFNYNLRIEQGSTPISLQSRVRLQSHCRVGFDSGLRIELGSSPVLGQGRVRLQSQCRAGLDSGLRIELGSTPVLGQNRVSGLRINIGFDASPRIDIGFGFSHRIVQASIPVLWSSTVRLQSQNRKGLTTVLRQSRVRLLF